MKKNYNLIRVLRRFQHCTDHIMTGSWKGRGNQYIQFVRALYCKLPTNGKQLPAFPLESVPGTEPRPQRSEARVLPFCHHITSSDLRLVTNTLCSPMIIHTGNQYTGCNMSIYRPPDLRVAFICNSNLAFEKCIIPGLFIQ